MIDQRCQQTCDKGSRCTLPAGHEGTSHPTEHGCECVEPSKEYKNALAVVRLRAALARAIEALEKCRGRALARSWQEEADKIDTAVTAARGELEGK